MVVALFLRSKATGSDPCGNARQADGNEIDEEMKRWESLALRRIVVRVGDVSAIHSNLGLRIDDRRHNCADRKADD
jgi:hypothetical protein